MANNKKMHFLTLTSDLKQTVLDWFGESHVRDAYYGEGLQNTLCNIDQYCSGINNNGEYDFDLWVAFLEGSPFGFLMTSSVVGPYDATDDYDKWYIDGENTFTLDLLIGPEAFLGKGLAHLMIQEFILGMFQDANFFLIDPAKSNRKAIHVYQNAGSETVDEFSPSYDPIPHLMMKMDVCNLRAKLSVNGHLETTPKVRRFGEVVICIRYSPIEYRV